MMIAGARTDSRAHKKAPEVAVQNFITHAVLHATVTSDSNTSTFSSKQTVSGQDHTD